jgi:DHA1 family multidrug resistance protein-like MFS transporter
LRQYAGTSWQRTLVIVFASQLITAIGFSSIFPFLPFYVKELGASTSLSIEFLAGLVYSAQGITMMIASPIWGTLADRYGRKLMVERAMYGGTVILLLMAFAQNAEQLVMLRAIQGLVTGTVAAANALVASVAPRRRMGFAMGVLQVGLGAGVALGPLMGGLLADLYGYSAAFYVTSALLFISGLLVSLGVHEDFQPPEKKQLRRGYFIQEWRGVLSMRGMSMAYTLRFLTQLGRMMIVPIAPLFIQSLLVQSPYLNTLTGLMTGVSAAALTISSVLLGQLGDRTSHRRNIVVAAAVATTLYLVQSRVVAAWQLLFLQMLVGVAMGGIIPSISALLARYSRAGEEGAVYGLDNSIVSGAGAVAPLVAVGIAEVYGLRASFIATATLFLTTSLLGARFLPPSKPARSPSTPADSSSDGTKKITRD